MSCILHVSHKHGPLSKQKKSQKHSPLEEVESALAPCSSKEHLHRWHCQQGEGLVNLCPFWSRKAHRFEWLDQQIYEETLTLCIEL